MTEVSPVQQAFALITKSRSVLIVLPEHPSTDAISSGLALYLLLQKLEKQTKVVANKFELPPSHSFLPKSQDIGSEIQQLRKFIISLDVSKTPVDELAYDIVGDKLEIFITPKKGFFKSQDVQMAAGDYTYDLVISLDAPTLPSLGGIFENNADFFYATPIINIDHHVGNEQFGQVNIVDIIATSVSEIVFEILKEFGHNLLDEHIATNLLAGIISKTKSFRSLSATPRSLNIASHLIAQGARREDIINNLFRTKSLPMIQLWGRALARLSTLRDGIVVYTKLNLNDFERSGGTESDLPGILDEIMVNTERAEIGVILFERKSTGTTGVLMASIKSHNGLDILKDFSPQGNQNLTRADVHATISEVEQQLVSQLEAYFSRISQ